MIDDIKGYIFDLDGTLIDSEPSVIDALNYSLEFKNISVTRDTLEKIRKATAGNIFDHFNLTEEETIKAKSLLKEHFVTNFHKIEVISGIFELLETLRSLGKTIGIWTARDLKSATAILNATKLIEYVEDFQTSDNLSENKPSPEGLELLASRLSLNAADIVMIGDHEHDIAAGKSFNCKTIWANWCPSQENTIKSAPNYSFDRVSDLTELLKVSL